MYKPDLLVRAIKYAAEAHYKQRVSGMKANYLYHLSCVATEVSNAYMAQGDFDFHLAMQAAWLHDVIEDTALTENDIQSRFGEKVSRVVLALTKDEALPKEVQLKDSVERILLVDREASIVKLADRISNLQPPPAFWTSQKIDQYKVDSFMILKKLGDSHSYLGKRLGAKISSYGMDP